MTDQQEFKNMPSKAVVEFTCSGKAVGKMRNELEVNMTKPTQESFVLATDEGSFHGGDATAPPPLALFVASLTGCIMTQIRAFSKRMGVQLNDLHVNTIVQWNWTAMGRIYETAPKSFEIDVMIDSNNSINEVKELVAAAKKGCFIEQTLGQKNSINHRIKTKSGWENV